MGDDVYFWGLTPDEARDYFDRIAVWARRRARFYRRRAAFHKRREMRARARVRNCLLFAGLWQASWHVVGMLVGMPW